VYPTDGLPCHTASTVADGLRWSGTVGGHTRTSQSLTNEDPNPRDSRSGLQLWRCYIQFRSRRAACSASNGPLRLATCPLTPPPLVGTPITKTIDAFWFASRSRSALILANDASTPARNCLGSPRRQKASDSTPPPNRNIVWEDLRTGGKNPHHALGQRHPDHG
jgi:hypothetical protein